MENNPRIPFQLATERPRFEPPGGKPLMVHVVVNLEVWPFGQPMPRSIFVTAHGKPEIPDIPNFSWVEYGLRCGVPRLIRILGERGLPGQQLHERGVPRLLPELRRGGARSGVGSHGSPDRPAIAALRGGRGSGHRRGRGAPCPLCRLSAPRVARAGLRGVHGNTGSPCESTGSSTSTSGSSTTFRAGCGPGTVR